MGKYPPGVFPMENFVKKKIKKNIAFGKPFLPSVLTLKLHYMQLFHCTFENTSDSESGMGMDLYAFEIPEITKKGYELIAMTPCEDMCCPCSEEL